MGVGGEKEGKMEGKKEKREEGKMFEDYQEFIEYITQELCPKKIPEESFSTD